MTSQIDRRRSGAFLSGSEAVFTQWAPGHRRVELVLLADDGATVRETIPMRAEGAFFTTSVPASDRILYKFRVDGDGPFPDPHSRSQPFGPHGASELRRSEFQWTDAGWRGRPLDELVIYEVHVGTATREGTFDALVARLDDIRSVGANTIELLPVATFPGARNWGYDGVQMFAPAAVYGGPEGLRRFVDAAHAKGLGVLIDAVWNHFGPDGNYLWVFGRDYFTPKVHTPWGDAVNYAEAPVREMATSNAEMWIRDYHADGLRLDATHEIHDDTKPHILREIAETARRAGAGRRVVVIAEDERNDANLVAPGERGGLGLDAVWADDFHHQVRRAFAGDSDGYFEDFTGSMKDLAETIQRGWFYSGALSKHSGKRRGTDPSTVRPPQLVYCIQNHDQVGNRALGDRLFASVDVDTYKAMSALLLFGPATPLLFMGQEWNASTPFLFFTDHNEELGRAVTRGRREEFKRFTSFGGAEVPDPQALSSFERSKLDWSERERQPHAGVLAWYRVLLDLRRTHPALASRERSSIEVVAIDEETLRLERRSGEARLALVVRRKGAGRVTTDEGARLLAASDRPEFGGDGRGITLSGSALAFSGPGAAVLSLSQGN